MSERPYERLIEESVGALCANPPRRLDLRGAMAALYRFQAQFDTQLTHFRVMENLLTHRFFYRRAISEAPDRNSLLARQATARDGVAYDSSAPTVTYFEGGQVYAEAGGDVWRDWVAAGYLAGADAEPPKTVSQGAVLAAIAACDDNADLVLAWFAAIVDWVHRQPDPDRDAILRADRGTARFRKAAHRLGAPARFREDPDQSPFREFGAADWDPESTPFCRWWFGVKAASTKSDVLIRAFAELDGMDRLPEPPRERDQIQERGSAAIRRARERALSIEDWADRLVSVAMAEYSRDLGPWGLLFTARLVRETAPAFVDTCNEPMVVDLLVTGLRTASWIRHLSQSGQPREEMSAAAEAFAVSNGTPTYTDAAGKSATDYCTETLLLFRPARVLAALRKSTLTHSAGERHYPWYQLEAFAALPETRGKRELRRDLTDAFADALEDGLERNHLEASLSPRRRTGTS